MSLLNWKAMAAYPSMTIFMYTRPTGISRSLERKHPVGYDLQEFVAADGKLCAAVLEQPFDAETIRVLIMDNGLSRSFMIP